ncbi:ribonuclease H-like protein [Chloropicon primus]|uniref:Ribonuclease H-like protein n=1 Tax=Chloropicon primus TaxID=1764295 RepID=A0A5B8MGS2_9CHLO|nr:ribonuclease H-like protein [Chloropicon primus]UPQ98809.1 ribonuclease H-like protein [Chloropicon primus]|eukprot:QDZ19597.1 ribonuclease H-like protein [Chloropicon primus]
MRRHLVNGATSSSDEDEATSVPSSSTTSNLFSALDGLDDEKLEEEVSSLRPPPAREPRKVKGALVWIDLEMTGLEVENHTIIEIACLVTDGNLDAKHIGPSLVIHQSEDAIAGMNEWSKEHHAKSGLTERVRQSRVTMEEAEAEVLKFVQKHTEAGRAQLAGNSVHTDYAFLRRYMPRLHAYLDYKLVDVTTVKELARRWFPREFRKRPRKTLQHTAMSDIEESLEELKYYKTRMFKRIKKSNGGY